MLILVEIALCLALIYALGALVCSVMHEGVAQMFALRWKSLNVALNDMLNPTDYARFMAHPLIKNLWDSSRKPTLIPNMVAARAIVHAFEPADQNPITDARELLATLPAALQRQIVPFLSKEIDSVQDLYRAAQSWFDNSMTAASDWYARQAHWLSILVAILFAIALNIDTVAIATKLAQEPIQRAALVELAQNTVTQYQQNPASVCPDLGTTIDPKTRLATCLNSLTAVGGDLIGWNKTAANQLLSWAILLQLIGWIASGLAMSLGARFWFDVLSKLISVRAGLAPAEADQPSKKPA